MIPKRYFNGDGEGNSSNNRRRNIFVKRNEYARFLSLLSRKVLTPTAGDKFKFSSSRDRRHHNEILRNHIEFSTKFVSKNTAVLRSISKNPYLLGGNPFHRTKQQSLKRVESMTTLLTSLLSTMKTTFYLAAQLLRKKIFRYNDPCKGNEKRIDTVYGVRIDKKMKGYFIFLHIFDFSFVDIFMPKTMFWIDEISIDH